MNNVVYAMTLCLIVFCVVILPQDTALNHQCTVYLLYYIRVHKFNPCTCVIFKVLCLLSYCDV